MPVSDSSSVRGIGVADSVEHVHAGPQALDLLLVQDAEALLLVDHEQTEVLERDVAGEQAVGPDHDVDVTGRDPRDDGVLLLRREEA